MTTYYKKKNPQTGRDDFYESGTDRYIGPNEYGSGAGFTEQAPQNQQYQGPRTQATTGNGSALDKFRKDQGFLDMLKDAIKRKQGRGKDISSARAYWGEQQRDPMTFTNESLRLLRPEQQRSLREKRYATAGAHMSALDAEEKARGLTMSDMIGEVRGVQEGENAAMREDRLRTSSDISNMRSLIGTGYELGAGGNLQKDFSGASASEIAQAMKAVESGGDYNIPGRSGETGAYQYTKGTWDSYSSQYARDVLKESRATLPMTPENQDKVTEYKVQKWLDAGYSPRQIVSMWNAGEGRPNAYAENWRGTNSQGVAYDTPAHVNKVMNALGQIYQGDGTIQHGDAWTESVVRGLSAASGTPFSTLWNTYTDDQLSALNIRIKQGTNEDLASKIDTRLLKQYGIPDRTTFEHMLTLKEAGHSDQEIMDGLALLGITLDLTTTIKNKDEEEETTTMTITEMLDTLTAKPL